MVDYSLDDFAQQLLGQVTELYEQKVLHWQGARLYAQDYFRLLDYQLTGSDGFLEGFNHWIDGINRLQPELEPRLKQDGTQLRLTFQGVKILPPWLKALICLAHVRMLKGISVDERPAPWCLELTQSCLGLDIQPPLPGLMIYFERDENAFSIPTYQLPEVCSHSPEFAHSLNQMMRQLRPDSRLKQDWLSNVKQWLDDALPTIIPLSELAENLGISGRTLQRRFREKGCSYQQLVDEVRYEQAMRQLANLNLSLKELAMRLGFAEQSGFQRAFRSWHGCSPGEYRKRISATAESSALGWPEVMLYLAENYNQTCDDFSRRGNKVWILVKNIAFEKEVTVVCQDLDGIWRRYAATFERFYTAGWELWSSSNLPVSEPFQFYLEYRACGALFIDDHWQNNYRLEAGSHAIIGPIDFVSREVGMIPTDDSYLFIGYAYSTCNHDHQVVAELLLIDGSITRANASKLWCNRQGVTAWRYAIPIKTALRNYRVVLESVAGCYFHLPGCGYSQPEHWL